MPSSQNLLTVLMRFSIFSPRSITSGLNPFSQSKYAANNPAGPLPTTTGRFSSLIGPHSGNIYRLWTSNITSLLFFIFTFLFIFISTS